MSFRRSAVALTLAACGIAAAGDIEVTSPNEGEFLGRNAEVSFMATDVERELRVVVTVREVGASEDALRVERRFDPDSDDEVNGDVDLSFGDNFPEGDYLLSVSADEPSNPSNTYPELDPIEVTIDVTRPRFKSASPLGGSFVAGDVTIAIELEEPNLREWRIRVDGADIPGGSGVGNVFSVVWSTENVTEDGPKRIVVTAEDEAGNTATRNIEVTLDRVRPTIDVLSPREGAIVPSAGFLAVAIDVRDQHSLSMDQFGVDVLITSENGVPLLRVPRANVERDGTTLKWSGLIILNRSIPRPFKLQVDARDRAGNLAVRQVVDLGGTRLPPGFLPYVTFPAPWLH